VTVLQAIVLALVQGVTEFLPISSQAHLILVPRLLGWPDHSLAFDIATNTGTLAAVMLYFRSEIVELTRGWLGSVAAPRRPLTPAGRLAWQLVLGTLPVVVAGLLFYDFIERERSPLLIASTSIVFGLLLWWADRSGRLRRQVEELGWSDALIIGVAQAVAILPGTSRSGATMTAALILGLTRPAAARFSFLLAIPVGILAGAHDLLDVARGRVAGGELLPMLIGLVVAAVSAYLVIQWLFAWLRRQGMLPFVVYRVLLGLAILAILYGLPG
jgi:undecaprenyl-diphosphatase